MPNFPRTLARLLRVRPLHSYLQLITSYRAYKQPLHHYLLGFILNLLPLSAYPLSVRVRHRHSKYLNIVATNHGDLITINEIFGWQVYKYQNLPGDIIVDLGANTGISASYFLSFPTTHHVYLFEPNPYLKDTCLLNLNRYNPSRYTLSNIAISNDDTCKNLHISDHSRYSSLSVDEASLNSTILVDCVTLATILSDIHAVRGRIDLLKIDIEGSGYISLDSIPVSFPVFPRLILIEEDLPSDLSLLWLTKHYSRRILPSGIYEYVLIEHS